MCGKSTISTRIRVVRLMSNDIKLIHIGDLRSSVKMLKAVYADVV